MRQPDRAFNVFQLIVAFIFGAVILGLTLGISGIQPRVKEDISFADFTVVVLSALGVMVAILTFFLGVLALFGWSAFRTIIEDKFEDLFRTRFDARNPEYGKVVNQLVEDVRAQMVADAVAQPLAANPADGPDDEIDPDDEAE